MPTTELQFWVPKFTASDVNKKNFPDKTLLVANNDINTLLWLIKDSQNLTCWYDPNGTGQEQVPVYWYPRAKALELVHELESEDKTLKAYRFMAAQINVFREKARQEFEQAELAAFSPKRRPR